MSLPQLTQGNTSPNTLSVPQPRSSHEGITSNTHGKTTSTSPAMRRGLSQLFHGTKKWGSFSKSTINKKKHGNLNYSMGDSNEDHRLRSICDFCNCLPIFHPIGPLKCTWDAIVMLMLIYTSVEIPYTLSFEIDLTLDSVFGIIAFCIDICLCIDIILNFRTAYFDKFDHLKLIINPTIIAKRYLCGWFAIDLITSLPIEFITFQNDDNLSAVGTYVKMFRFFRLIRVVKILRLLKMVKLFDGVMKRIVVREMLVAFRLFKIISCMLLYAHFSACIWYYIGCTSNEKYEISWISEHTNLVTECHEHEPDHPLFGMPSSDVFTRYSYAWYWSVVTLFTTGYGDITATNIAEQWMASVSILIGTCFFAYFIGTLTTLISEGDRISSEIISKMEEAQHFCDKKKLPREMARAVLTHTRYHCNYNCILDENSVLANLPPYLQMDISLYVARTYMLSNIDFFNEKILDPVVRGAIALKMRSISCNNGYRLYKKGDLANEIYIQRTGTSMHLIETEVNNRIKKKKIRLNRGDVCGEYSLITKKRASTVLCATWCEFYVIEINDIKDALQEHYGNRWEKKWIKIKKFVKKEYMDKRWAKKRHLALERHYSPSLTKQYSLSKKAGASKIEMHAMWSAEAAMPSIRSTIRSEGISDNMMFQHIAYDSELNAQACDMDMDTDIKHIDTDEPNVIRYAQTMPSSDPVDILEHVQTKAKSVDEIVTNIKEKRTRKAPKSTLRWLASLRTETWKGGGEEEKKKAGRESKKKKKSVAWFGLTRQNSELRDQVVVADTVNIDKIHPMFADYSSQSDEEPPVTMTRCKSEHHIKRMTNRNHSPNSLFDDFNPAASEPVLCLQRSRSINALDLQRKRTKRMRTKKEKEKHVDPPDQIDKESAQHHQDVSLDIDIDSDNTDPISINNDSDASASAESSNTLQSIDIKANAIQSGAVKSNKTIATKTGGNKSHGKFKMKKHVQKQAHKNRKIRKIDRQMEHKSPSDDGCMDMCSSDEDESVDLEDLPNTSIGGTLNVFTLSEIEEDILLNKSFSTSNKSTNDAESNQPCITQPQLSLVFEEDHNQSKTNE